MSSPEDHAYAEPAASEGSVPVQAFRLRPREGNALPTSPTEKGRCRLCGGSIRIDRRTGKVLAHPRADRRAGQCPESAKQRYRPGAPQTPLYVLSATGTSPAVARRPRSTIREVPVPRPSWIPLWGDVEAPVVTLPAKGRTGYWIPEHGWQKHERFVHDHVHGGARPEWERSTDSWAVATDHFIELAGTLVQRHGRILLGREFNSSEQCNPRCRSARGYVCTCSCRARNHGGGGWMRGWRVADDTTLIVDGRSWSWTMLEKISPGASRPR